MSALRELPALGVRRPLLVWVLNVLIALAGLVALNAIEVRELPDVDRPIVTVRGEYPGASPETMDSEVTRLVEGAVARVSGVRAIRSSSEENNFRMRVEFAPGRDLDTAAAEVREAVSRVERELPPALERLSVIKADQDASPIIRIAVRSAELEQSELALRVERDVIPELLSIDGVADVTLFGERQRLLRVVVDPLRLASFGLAVADVAEALRQAPFDVPAGSFRSRDQQLIVRAEASALSAERIRAITLAEGLRIGDVARVFFAPEDAESIVLLDGEPVIGLGVVRQAGANTIDISSAVERALERLDARFDDLELVKTSDDADFIRGAVREVLISLALTSLIVIVTLWLFLGTPALTLIPALVIPLALTGTLVAVWVLGFSINLLTLLALVLATGLIVDDAIVVLENIQRRASEGLGRRAAAVLGTQQVFFAVIATTAVLMAVFLPIALLPDTAGQLFREFGLVLVVAVSISTFIALSLVPALAARLPTGRRAPHGWPERLGVHLARGYGISLAWALRHPLMSVLLGLILALAAGGLFTTLERELLPQEDRGVLYLWASAPDGVTLAYSERQGALIEQQLWPLREGGEATSMLTIVGRFDPNRVWSTINLAPHAQRTRDARTIIRDYRRALSALPGVRASLFSPNSLGLRRSGGALEVAITGSDYTALYKAAQQLRTAIESQLGHVLLDPRLSYQPTQPQLSFAIDRQRAADLGIDLNDLALTLRSMIDGNDVVDLSIDDQSVPLRLEAISSLIDEPSDLINLHVRGHGDQLLPLSSVVTLVEEGVAAELDRHAQRRAIEIDAELAPDVTLAEAVAALRTLANAELPVGMDLILLGEAQTLDETSREFLYACLLVLVVTFLVLCAQFESLGSASVVMLVVPFGLAAAVLALWLTGTSVNVYSQIGLIMLIGLMAKNSILLVEFAEQLRDQGLSALEAVQRGAEVRLRPVVMTVLSTALGGLPLILGSGPGAEARAAIGWVVFGGLFLAALFTLYLTPVLHLMLARYFVPRSHHQAQLEAELAAVAKSE